MFSSLFSEAIACANTSRPLLPKHKIIQNVCKFLYFYGREFKEEGPTDFGSVCATQLNSDAILIHNGTLLSLSLFIAQSVVYATSFPGLFPKVVGAVGTSLFYT